MKILEKLQARYKEVDDKLKVLGDKDSLTVVEIKELGDGSLELESIAGQIESIRRVEKAGASRAVLATVGGADSVEEGGGQNGDGDIPIESKDIKRLTTGKAYAAPKTLKKGYEEVAVFGGALMKAKSLGENPLKVLEDEGYYGVAKKFFQANKTLNTGTTTAGGFLLPTPLANEIIELLYPATTFLQGGPRRVQLVNNKLEIPGGASGATAGWVAEAGAKPYTEPTFRKIDLQGKKLAGIVAMTQEQVRFSLPDVQAFVEADLQMAMSEQLDIAAWLGSGSGAVPQGILNKSGIGSYVATNSLTPTIANIDADMAKLTLGMASNNIRTRSKWVIVMHDRTLTYMQNLRDGIAGYAYPTLNLAQPTFKGIPVLTTNNFPINLGSGTNESLIVLVDFNHVIYGQSMDLVMRTSDVASVDMGSGAVSAFQNNLIYLLMEMMADVELRIAAAVQKLTAVKWGG